MILKVCLTFLLRAGEKWKPVPTQPEEFHFSQRVSVRALEKPHVAGTPLARPATAPQHGRSVSAAAATPAPAATPGAAPVTYNEFVATLRAAWDDADDQQQQQQQQHHEQPQHQPSAVVNASRDSDDGAAATMQRIAQLLADLGTPSTSLATDSSATGAAAAAAVDALLSGSSSNGAGGVSGSGPSAEWLRRSREKHDVERAQQESEMDRDDDALVCVLSFWTLSELFSLVVCSRVLY